MLITKKTKTKDLLPILNGKRVDMILEAVDEYPLDKPLVNMTIGEFLECLEDDYTMKFLTEKYVYKAFGKMKSFKRQLEEITKYLEMNKIEPTSEQRSAAAGVQFLSFEENMIYTVTEFFHLKSFDEADSIKLSNFLLINKKESGDTKFQYNYNKIMEQKHKMKNGKR